MIDFEQDNSDIRGYVKLFYRLQNNPIWKQLSPAVLKVAIGMLLKANFKPAKWYDGKRQIDLPAGSFASSYSEMATFCNLSIKQVRDAYQHLGNLNFSTYIHCSTYTIVQVTNYDKYQGRKAKAETGTMTGAHLTANSKLPVSTTYSDPESTQGIDKGNPGATRGQGEGKAGATPRHSRGSPVRKDLFISESPEESVSHQNGNDRLTLIAGILRDFPDLPRILGREPPLDIVQQVSEAATQAAPVEIFEVLKSLNDRGKRPSKSWGWFPAVVKNHFQRNGKVQK